MHYRAIQTTFKLCNKSIKSIIAFEKEVAKLKTITDKYYSNKPKVKELINWFRKEYEKRPEAYAGDHIILSEVIDNISKGLTMNKAIMATRNTFKAKFALMDITRHFNY